MSDHLCFFSCGQEEPTYSALWGDNKAFNEVIISPAMLNEHMPHMVMKGLNKVSFVVFCHILLRVWCTLKTGLLDMFVYQHQVSMASYVGGFLSKYNCLGSLFFIFGCQWFDIFRKCIYVFLLESNKSRLLS